MARNVCQALDGGEIPVPAWLDRSGIKMDLVRGAAAAARPNSLGLIGVMHTRMSLPPPRSPAHVFRYNIGPFGVRLAPDFAAAEGGRVTLVAAHLHGHGMVKRYETGLIRGGGGGGEGGGESGAEDGGGGGGHGGGGGDEPFAIIAEYGGYGPDQSYHAVPLGAPGNTAGGAARGAAGGGAGGMAVTMGPDDVMYVACTYDTRGAPGARPVTYGVGPGRYCSPRHRHAF